MSTKNLVFLTNIRQKVDIVIFFDYIKGTYNKERGLRVKLKKWMLLNDIDRQEFTETLGVTYTTLSGYCSCRRPGLDMAIKIHNITNGQVSFADFYNDRLDPRLEIAQ